MFIGVFVHSLVPRLLVGGESLGTRLICSLYYLYVHTFSNQLESSGSDKDCMLFTICEWGEGIPKLMSLDTRAATADNCSIATYVLWHRYGLVPRLLLASLAAGLSRESHSQALPAYVYIIMTNKTNCDNDPFAHARPG